MARENIFLSKTTVHKYMNQDLKLHCVCRKRKSGYKKGHAHKIFPNLLQQKFQTNGFIRFNCTIIDLYDHSVVASENGKHISSELAIRTLNKEIHASKCDSSQLILHSDQGSQFTSLEFTNYCSYQSITQNMSRAGCPYDNTPMERYYNTLKAELVNQYNFQTDEELNRAILEFRYLWYNQIWPHSFNLYTTPFKKRFHTPIRQWCYQDT